MSTRSAIIAKQQDGTYAGVYCHSDGYLDWNGKRLLESFDSEEKARELVALGGISSIGRGGEVTAYCRDMGYSWDEESPIPGSTPKEVADAIGHDGFVYLFENGMWKVSVRGTDFIPVVDALNNEVLSNL